MSKKPKSRSPKASAKKRGLDRSRIWSQSPDQAGDELPEKHVTIRQLSDEDRGRLETHRSIVAGILGSKGADKMTTPENKLMCLQAIIEAGVLTRDHIVEAQSMGIVLGDVFVELGGMKWIMVKDEHGEFPAVCLPGTLIVLTPLTMIWKHVDAGEAIDIYDIYNGAMADVERAIEARKAQGLLPLN